MKAMFGRLFVGGTEGSRRLKIRVASDSVTVCY
jgi:hypothetical protein